MGAVLSLPRRPPRPRTPADVLDGLREHPALAQLLTASELAALAAGAKALRAEARCAAEGGR